MKLIDIVVRDCVLPGLTASTRDEALAEIIDTLVSAGSLDSSLRDEFLAAIITRENKGSTGFGHGVAVPHVKHSAIDTMVVAVANSPEGVDFNALDGDPVHSIFLLLSPEDRPEDHLDAMEVIFNNLSQETFRRFLRNSASVDDIIVLLEEADASAEAR